MPSHRLPFRFVLKIADDPESLSVFDEVEVIIPLPALMTEGAKASKPGSVEVEFIVLGEFSKGTEIDHA